MASTSEEDDEPYQCAYCDKVFKSQLSLSAHEQTHTAVRKQCPNCDKSFLCPKGLKLHIQTHNGIYRFHCEICNRGCATKYRLKNHMITHTGERPFPCPQCGQGCNSKGDLNRHFRTHSNERPFSCLQCSKKFLRREHLKKHVTNVHKKGKVSRRKNQKGLSGSQEAPESHSNTATDIHNEDRTKATRNVNQTGIKTEEGLEEMSENVSDTEDQQITTEKRAGIQISEVFSLASW